MKPKYILFDCFNTIFNMAGVPREELTYYSKILRSPLWQPLNLPPKWKNLSVFEDCVDGLNSLKSAGYCVCALSNAPLALMTQLSSNNDIKWSHIIALEKYKIYKPNPLSYLTACAELDCRPSECLMVTANQTFGDLEGSAFVGMSSKLIRNDTGLDVSNLINVI